MYLSICSVDGTFCLGIYNTKEKAKNSIIKYFKYIEDSDEILKTIVEKSNDDRIKDWKDIVKYLLNDHKDFSEHDNNDYCDDILSDLINMEIFECKKNKDKIEIFERYDGWILSDNYGNHIKNIINGLSSDGYIREHYVDIDIKYMAKSYPPVSLSRELLE